MNGRAAVLAVELAPDAGGVVLDLIWPGTGEIVARVIAFAQVSDQRGGRWVNVDVCPNVRERSPLVNGTGAELPQLPEGVTVRALAFGSEGAELTIREQTGSRVSCDGPGVVATELRWPVEGSG
jgi:hypothetical protein